MSINLMFGNCLERMKEIPDGSVDMILCDLPYGTTACKWDVVIDFKKLWREYNRICKGCIVLFASQPFTTVLIQSNIKNYRYSWVWKKNFSTNFLHAKRMPLRNTEDIVVFNKGVYNPQKSQNHIPTQSAKGSKKGSLYHGKEIRDYVGGSTERYPTTLLEFSAQNIKNRLHPTQKPVDLCEYLIKTYTNECDTVLDNCMGSGTTGVACLNTNRSFIGIEKDEEYFEIAKKRIEQIDKQLKEGVE